MKNKYVYTLKLENRIIEKFRLKMTALKFLSKLKHDFPEKNFYLEGEINDRT